VSSLFAKPLGAMKIQSASFCRTSVEFADIKYEGDLIYTQRGDGREFLLEVVGQGLVIEPKITPRSSLGNNPY